MGEIDYGRTTIHYLQQNNSVCQGFYFLFIKIRHLYNFIYNAQNLNEHYQRKTLGSLTKLNHEKPNNFLSLALMNFAIKDLRKKCNSTLKCDLHEILRNKCSLK